eukprot:c13650_g1_i2.p1 GENE.c13650_g1_i2~~c13650_g1_i2.p1  ORF type:complete len:301 (+),score=54.84 c13650_g1_i2:59-904(+)
MTTVVNDAGTAPSSEVYQLVLDLLVPDKRERTLAELSRMKEKEGDLAPVLWHSFGTMAVLLQEIMSIYPLLSPPNLSAQASSHVCNALSLFQCVASHPDTRVLFLNAHIPLYLYPFLNTVSKTRPFECLRLASLGVIASLVRVDDTEVIHFLLSTEIIPLCLRVMESGSELPKTVACFILQKVLVDEIGLSYICSKFDRFASVSGSLANVVNSLLEKPTVRLLRPVIRCYLRLSENTRARDALRGCLPMALRDSTFNELLKDDNVIKRWWAQLLHNLQSEQ